MLIICLSISANGINIIIALGHSGYEIDKKIAMEVEDVDVVVGGHSHSFLFTGLDNIPKYAYLFGVDSSKKAD